MDHSTLIQGLHISHKMCSYTFTLMKAACGSSLTFCDYKTNKKYPSLKGLQEMLWRVTLSFVTTTTTTTTTIIIIIIIIMDNRN